MNVESEIKRLVTRLHMTDREHTELVKTVGRVINDDLTLNKSVVREYLDRMDDKNDDKINHHLSKFFYEFYKYLLTLYRGKRV